MSTATPQPKERLALLRFEVICHIKSLRQEGLPLAECVRKASSCPWPGPEGTYYSYRTIETWWYDYAKSGYQGLAGKTSRADVGKSRSIDEELGLWLLDAVAKSPETPLAVLYRHWEDHGRGLPSLKFGAPLPGQQRLRPTQFEGRTAGKRTAKGFRRTRPQ